MALVLGLHTPQGQADDGPRLASKGPFFHTELEKSSSLFLQSYAKGPVQWHAFGPEAFREAKRRNQPIFLTIGAAWCQWCLQMGDETFTHPQLAALLNDKFIPVLVDRDLLPEVDRRYQRVVLTLTGHGGWPLIAVLTPEGDVIYGGGYFTAENWKGRPGLVEILQDLERRYRQNAEIMTASAQKTTQRADAIESILAGNPPPAAKTALEAEEKRPWQPERVADHMVGAILDHYDPVNGGFAYTPRFPQAAALEMLLSYAEYTGLSAPLDRATHTLDKMADGAIRDPLTGLFFRYSEDASWQEPGFEVLLSTNAELLSVYLHAYQLTKKRRYREIAEELTSALLTYFQLPEGGFAASLSSAQPGQKHSDFYAWRLDELENLLSPEELPIAVAYLGLDKNAAASQELGTYIPLHASSLPQIAKGVDLSVREAKIHLDSALEKLTLARNLRPGQARDEALLTPWNMQAASSLLQANRILDYPAAHEAALKAIGRVSNTMGPEITQVPLMIGEAGPQGAHLSQPRITMVLALLDAFESTGEIHYLSQAQSIMDTTIATFWDAEQGGFYDLSPDRRAKGLMATPWKDIIDGLTPATNGLSAQALTRLAMYSGDSRYQALAQENLAAFDNVAGQLGLLGSTYGQALLMSLHRPPVVVIIVPKQGDGTRLLKAANRTYRPGMGTVVVNQDQLQNLTGLPVKWDPTATAPSQAQAWVCHGKSCEGPYQFAEELEMAIHQRASANPGGIPQE